MTMSLVLTWVFIHLGVLIVLISYWLLSEALFPRLVERSQERYDRYPIRTFFWGVLIVVPLVAIGVAMLSQSPNGLVKVLGAALLLTLLLTGLMGSAGLSRLIGQRLPSPTDETQPWRRVLRGGIILSLTFILPLVGWLMLLPATLISGCGATFIAWRTGRKESASPPTDPDTQASAA